MICATQPTMKFSKFPEKEKNMGERTNGQEDPEELLLRLVGTCQSEARSLLERIKEKHRNEFADDLHRADRPSFATGEDPDLVVRTTRAIDLRLIEQGSQAPYYVAPGEEDPDRFDLRHRAWKGSEYFRTRTGMFSVLVEQVIDEKAADWMQVRFKDLPEGLPTSGREAHAKAVEKFVGKSVTWTGEKTADGYTFIVEK